MDDMKGKVKSFMKKVNNPFSSSSSSSSSFRGQGRVLGSGPSPSPSSSSSHPRSSPPTRPLPKPIPRPSDPNPNPSPDFNPFDPFISSSASRRPANGASPALFRCPVCARPFHSEAEVSAHVDSCLTQDPPPPSSSIGATGELAARVSAFVSAAPPDGSVEVVRKLLGNVAREPGNDKFRRIRMGNPKIKDAVAEVDGGVELLECVGFRIGEEDGEIWATMGVPAEEQIAVIRVALSLLDGWKSEELKSQVTSDVVAERSTEPEKIDRLVRVFFSVPDSVAADIDLPDSFYDLSVGEVKRDTDMRKKRLEESRLLIPKSYKDKQALATRKKYKRTVVRIQFPDGVILQGVFLPWEPTGVLYEFVSSALKEPSLEFELLRPAIPKLRVIPHFPRPGERAPTLEDEDLVPSALLKFKPVETYSIAFTGLTDELLEISEPLTAATSVSDRLNGNGH